MNTVENKIARAINRKPKGKLLFPEDFIDYGSSDAVRKTLERLKKKGFIERIAKGIYVKPKMNSYIGNVLPSAEEVAKAIARRDRAHIIPTGSYALNALGLSTQVPMKIVLLTDGSPREIRIGRRTIKLKRTSPKNLQSKGKISGLVIQALKEIGNDRLTQEEENKIIDLLKKERPHLLLTDMRLAPAWIQKIFKKALYGGT